MNQRGLCGVGFLIACGDGGSFVLDPPLPTDSGTSASLELCINEIVAINDNSWQDDSGAFPDWVELHNPQSHGVSLAGWHLTDDVDEPPAAPLDGSLVIEAGGFLLFSLDGQPDLGPTHLSFSLDGAGEAIGLYRADGVGEVLAFDEVVPDYAWARQPDCCGDLPHCMNQVWMGTPGSPNDVR